MLDETIARIGPADEAAMAAARALQDRLTKPAGSLGELEALSVRLAGLAGACPPPLPQPAALAIFAGDHGVHAQGVTPWPMEVTGQMVANFLAGTAVANAFARQVAAPVTVVDVGISGVTPQAAPGPAESPAELAGPPASPAAGAPSGADPWSADAASGSVPAGSPVPEILSRRIRSGTSDISKMPAMTRPEAVAAIEVGIEVAALLIERGARLLVAGDMGIANTTPAAALVAAFTGLPAAEVTGRGTGVPDDMLAHKIAVVGRALALHRPDPADPVGVLASVGGLEHAAIAGFVLGAAAARIPVIVDGVIACSGALAAAALAPDSVAAMVAGHRSVEPGASAALIHLGLTPLIDLGLRLGEGTGALLAVPLVAAAVRVLHEVATFDSAGVSHK